MPTSFGLGISQSQNLAFNLGGLAPIDGGPGTFIVDRFWVGGTGNTNDTAHWSLTSGGAGGASVPTAAANALFDANSGGGTVTVNATLNCFDFNMTGFTGTLAGSSSINAKGDFIFGAGITRTWSGSLILSATTTDNVITMNGKTLASTLTFTGTGSWQYTDTFVSSGNITLTTGTMIGNGQTISCQTFNSNNSNIRTLNIDNSILNISADFGAATSTNFTISSTGGTINFTGVANVSIGSGLNFGTGTVNFTTNTATLTLPSISGSGTFGTITRSNTSAYNALVFNGSFTITNSFSVVGADANYGRILVSAIDPGSPATITCNGSCTLTNVDFQGINAAGSATWSGTSVGDCLLNTGITFSTPRTLYLSRQTAGLSLAWKDVFATSSGGTPGQNMPLGQDIVIVDASSIGASGVQITVSSPSGLRIPDLDLSAVGTTFEFVSSSSTVYLGNLNVVGTNSGVGGILSGHGKTITYTRNATSAGTMVFNTTGTINLATTLVCSSTITYVRGTLNQNGFKITCTVFARSGVSTLVWNKNDVEVTATSGTVFNFAAPTNATINDSGETKVSGSSASNKTVNFGTLTWNNYYNAATGGGAVIISGTNIFNDMKFDPATVNTFSGGIIQRMQTITANGTLGNLITFQSSNTNNYQLISLSGTPVACTFMSISRSTASGATFTATSSTDGGNNSGWTITP